MQTLEQLLQAHADLCDQQKVIVDQAMAEKRGLTEEEEKSFNELQGQIDGLVKTIDLAKKVAERDADLAKPATEPYRPPVDPGHRQQDKPDDGGFSNVAEFLAALRWGDPKGRIQALPQGSGSGGVAVPEAFRASFLRSVKNEWSMTPGSGGGYAVPVQFRETLLQLGAESSIVRPLATVLPAGDPPDAEITMPALAQGDAGVFGGVELQWIGEGELKPETSASLREIKLEPQEVAGHTVITDKLLRNWATASTYIEALFNGARAAGEDYAFLRGDGNAKPKGVTNGAGTIAVNRKTAGKFQFDDVVKMYAALVPEAVPGAIWVINQSLMPQVAALKDESNNTIFIRGDITRGMPSTLMGLPVRFTGRTPVAGTKGDVILANFSYYLIKDGSGPFVAASEHVLFRQNKTVIKCFWNVDGQGWVNQPLLLEDGSTKVSPYVVLN